MANEFKFNAQEATGVANKLKQKANKLQATQKDLGGEIKKVSGWWEGESQTAFIDQYKRFEPSLEQLAELANSIAKQMEEISRIKTEGEQKRAKMFK